MNVDVGIGKERLPEGLPAQMEPGLRDGRPLSVASSASSDIHHDHKEFAEELWEELEVIL